MSKFIIACMVLLSASLSNAETTKEPVEGTGKKTWDQPVYESNSNVPGVNIPANPGPMEPANPSRKTPPYKGVISVRRDADREFPIDALPGSKGTVLNIDPEREFPIDALPGNKGTILAVDPMGVGPAKQPGVDFPDPMLGRISVEAPIPPWENEMPKFEIVQEMARSLQGVQINDNASYMAIATAGLMAATYYFFAARSGAATTAAVTGPAVFLQTAMGDEIKISTNELYDETDILDFRDQVLEISSETEGQAFMEQVDPEFLEYWNTVNKEVRKVRSEAYQKACPNPDMCS